MEFQPSGDPIFSPPVISPVSQERRHYWLTTAQFSTTAAGGELLQSLSFTFRQRSSFAFTSLLLRAAKAPLAGTDFIVLPVHCELQIAMTADTDTDNTNLQQATPPLPLSPLVWSFANSSPSVDGYFYCQQNVLFTVTLRAYYSAALTAGDWTKFYLSLKWVV